MSDGDALLAAILAEPDEDTPRLAFADWLDEVGGEAERVRAEFIRVQIELTRVPVGDPRPVELVSREKRLLTAHRETWLAPFQAEGEPLRGGDAHGQFRRGFVEVVWMPAAWFLLRAERLFSLTPARELRITRTTLPEFAALVHSPFFGRLNTLDLSDPRLGDELVKVLTRRAASLTTLRLRGCGLTDMAAFWLADTDFNHPVMELDVSFNAMSPAGLAVLRDRFGDAVIASLRAL
jgi:uncharacterized protein (TIGR02996 family)